MAKIIKVNKNDDGSWSSECKKYVFNRPDHVAIYDAFHERNGYFYIDVEKSNENWLKTLSAEDFEK